jgi:hypothetical protein
MVSIVILLYGEQNYAYVYSNATKTADTMLQVHGAGEAAIGHASS